MKKFDVEKEVNNVVSFIQDYYKQNNLGGAYNDILYRNRYIKV